MFFEVFALPADGVRRSANDLPVSGVDGATVAR
jgi:hypothetical protein